MLKRTLIVVPLTFALIMYMLPLQSVHSVIMTETELAALDAKDAAAREIATTTDYGANQKSNGNGFVRALKSPFKALGRLFGGGKKNKLERMSEKDLRNFESTPADPIKTTKAAKATTGEKRSANLKNQPSDHLVQGREHLNSGSLNEAVAELSASVSINPTSAEAYNLLGLAYEQKGLRDRALKSLEKAVRLDGDESEYLNNLGYLLFKNREYEKATKYLKRAVKLAPDNPRIWNNLGLAQAEREQFDDAYKSFAKAVGEFKGHENIAIRMESLGYKEEAIKHLEMAATLKPGATDVLTRLASLYDGTGRLRQAQGVRSYLVALQTLAKIASK
jgi:Flp pilus assembly protein TadD